MPRHIIDHQDTPEPHKADPRDRLIDYCPVCKRYHWQGLGHVCEARRVQPLIRWPGAIALIVIAALMILGLLQVHAAHAREGKQPEPVAAPQSLLRARRACPVHARRTCYLTALRHAYEAVAWQRQARWRKAAGKSTDVVRDAITWASHQTGVAAWRLTAIASCESHLFFLAHNGQYLGVWQLGLTHRSDPIFRVVPWMDPYAQAIHVARFIRAHGESQWQCTSTGGLRW